MVPSRRACQPPDLRADEYASRLNISVYFSGQTVTSVTLAEGSGLKIIGSPTQETCDRLIESFTTDRLCVELDWGSVTPFTRRVLEALLTIPCSQTRTYGQIAEQVGCPKGPRAVGQACGRNPFPLLIPCHRVLGTNGLRGFAFGLEIKKRLLEIEVARQLHL